MPRGLLLLLFAALISCSHAGIKGQEPTDLGKDLGRELLERGPLAPFAPRSPSSLSHDQLQDLIREFSPARSKRQAYPVTPVVIVPSMLGSKLQAQLNGYQTAYWYCLTEWKEWFTIWVNEIDVAPGLLDCFSEQMSLHLDNQTGRSLTTPGVAIRYLDYGGIDGVNYLDDWNTIGVWNTTTALLQSLGWQAGTNLRAAPYDFRMGPETFAKEDWPRLRALIEDTYNINNKSKVVAVSLSMGGPYFLGFLNQQSQEWKDKYLRSFVSWDGAFGGSPSAITALTSLDNWWSQKIFSPVALRRLVQSWPSAVWLMPLAQLYGWDQVWVSTVNPPRNYTTADLAQLLIDASGYNASKLFRILQSKSWYTFDAPGVESHCFFGTGVRTPIRNTYNSTAFDTHPIIQWANGDGVVPEEGLRMLEKWRGKQAHGIFSYPMEGLYHGGSAQNKQVLRMFLELLTTS